MTVDTTLIPGGEKTKSFFSSDLFPNHISKRYILINWLTKYITTSLA